MPDAVEGYVDDFEEEEEAPPSVGECTAKRLEQDVLSPGPQPVEVVVEAVATAKAETAAAQHADRPEVKAQSKHQDKLAASYDSATLDSAIGLLDMKLLCRCFAYAVEKHIAFSQGHALLSELGNTAGGEPQQFTYKFNKMLKINVPTKIEGTAYTTEESKVHADAEEKEEEEKKDKVPGLDAEKCKQLISESFSAITGQYVPPELLNSYLTFENAGEEDIDLTYTQTHLDDFIKTRT